MSILDVFDGEGFGVSTLTATVNDMDSAPSMLRDSGLFQFEGVTTDTVQIEKYGNKLKLVPSRVYGGIASTGERQQRTLIPFNLVHLPQRDTLLAASIKNVREFGSETKQVAVKGELDRVIGNLKANLDATIEWQLMGALKGKVLDHDGTVIDDIYARFGITEVSKSLVLNTAGTQVLSLIVQAKRAAAKKVGGVMISKWACPCSPDLFDKLISHKEIRAAHVNNEQFLSGDYSKGFMYGGVRFYVYDVTIGGQDFLEAGSGLMHPEGVRGLFIGRFGPADYIETVGSKGLPMYAKQERMEFNKGIKVEVQSNTISLCTQLDAITKFTIS